MPSASPNVTYCVPHGCSSCQMHPGVIGPLLVVEARAVVRVPGTVEEVMVSSNQAHGCLPVPDSLGPLRIGLVSKILIKTRCDVEEAPIRYGVLVVVPVVEKEDLPPQSPPASRLVPSTCLGVEDRLCKRQPRRSSVTQIW